MKDRKREDMRLMYEEIAKMNDMKKKSRIKYKIKNKIGRVGKRKKKKRIQRRSKTKIKAKEIYQYINIYYIESILILRQGKKC